MILKQFCKILFSTHFSDLTLTYTIMIIIIMSLTPVLSSDKDIKGAPFMQSIAGAVSAENHHFVPFIGTSIKFRKYIANIIY